MAVYVTEAEVAELLSAAEALAAVEASFERIARGAVESPPRVRAELPGGVFAAMPCVDHELGYAGLKSYVWLPGGTPFVVVLFSIERAELAAVVEADALGQLRTAAASAAAAKRLARPDARTLGIFGCGRQAASHVAALRGVLPSLDRVVVHARNAERLDAFCAEHVCEPANDPREAGSCDVVVTVTTAKEPVLRGDWLCEGAFVCAVGANDPASRELDDAVFERASIVCCDSREQSMLEAGDLIGAVRAGVVDWPEVHELHEATRETGAQIAVFESNGLAAWDLAAAARVLELRA